MIRFEGVHFAGFEVTGQPCCATGDESAYLCNKAIPFACSDASKYVFFDSVHLTQKSYSIISQAFLSQIGPDFY